MASGMRTVGLAQAAQLALQLLSVAILARLLTPHAFGLVAMVMVVIGVAELFRDMGLSNAAIQAPELSVGLRSNLFWVNTGIGALLTAVTAASSTLIAGLYDQPELVAITIALSPTFLLSGVATQYRVHLIRGLRFKALSRISLSVPALSLVAATIAALGGLEVWAIVVQALTSAVLTVVLLVIACRWLPGRPVPSTGVRGMLTLGSAFLGSSLLTYLRMNADTFIIGHRFGSEALGLYNRSVQLIRNPIRQLQQPFGSVVVPIAARVRADDAAFMATLREYQPLMGYGICALASLVVGAPQDVVRLALGDQWLHAAPVMTVVAASAAVSAAAQPVSWLYTARGMGRALLGYTSFTTILTITLILAGAQFGLVGAAAGYLASTLVSFPIAFLRAEKLTGLPMIRLGITCARPLVLLGTVWACSFALRSMWHAPPPVGIVIALAMMGLVFAVSLVIPGYLRDYKRLVQTVRSMR